MGWLIAGWLSRSVHLEGLAPLLLLCQLLLGGVVFAVATLLRHQRAARGRPARGRDAGRSPAAVATQGAAGEWRGDACLDEGMRDIRRMDPKFDPARFTGYIEMLFGSDHTARTSGDIASLHDRVTPQLCSELQVQRDQLRVDGGAAPVAEFDIRARVTEVWHEEGRDYLTAYIVGVRLDYTTDARTGALVAGSKAVPRDVESFWTFTRLTGLNPWMLSAIQTP